MNVEQRRSYNERVSRMSNDQLMKESQRLNWRIDLSAGTAVLSLVAISTLAGVVIGIHQYTNPIAEVAAAGLLGGLAYSAKKSQEYTHRTQVVFIILPGEEWN